MNPPVDYVTGGSVAGCPTSPPKGSYQETYGSGVDVSTASCPGATFKFWYYTNAGNPAQILTYSTPSITFDMDQVTSVTPAFEQSTGPVCTGCITVTSEEYSVNATVSPLGDQTLQSGGSVTFTFEAPPGWTGWVLYGGSAGTLITSGTSSSVTLTYAKLSGYGFSSLRHLLRAGQQPQQEGHRLRLPRGRGGLLAVRFPDHDAGGERDLHLQRDVGLLPALELRLVGVRGERRDRDWRHRHRDVLPARAVLRVGLLGD